VKWLGFDVVEATWEPLEVLLADVPALVHRAAQDSTHPSFKNLQVQSSLIKKLTTTEPMQLPWSTP
jgi:hypothetical protein